MAIPYLGTWDNSFPVAITPGGVTWDNRPPATFPRIEIPGSGGMDNRPPVGSVLVNRPPDNSPPVQRFYAPSGITQDVGYVLLNTGPSDKIILSSGGFLLIGGTPGSFSNVPPTGATLPAGGSGGGGWNDTAPVGRANAFPPFNNSPALPSANAYPPMNNTGPGAGALPPGQSPPNNLPPVGITIPASANNLPPVPI